MQWKLTLSDVSLDEDTIEAGLEALRSNWLTMGPRTQKLEQAFAERVGAAHGVALSSGTAGLHMACAAVGVGPGDEVVVPSLSFIADAHAPHWCGGEAVLADLESAQKPLSGAEQFAARITDRTKAVLVVHMFGYTVDVAPIRELCAERGIAVIEDACEATGATLPGGSPAGSMGDVSAFSFFSKSQIPVGEGGIACTSDEAHADRMRLLRSHAMTSVTWDRHRGHAETYDVVDLGFNYRLDEPRAAMAQAQLPKLEDKLAGLRRVVGAYRDRLGGVDGVEVPFTGEEVERSAHFAFPVLVADGELRDAVRDRLAEAGVQTTFYPSMSEISLYEEAGRRSPCPVAEEVASRHLALPLSATMSAEQVEMACTELESAIAPGL